MRPDVDRPADEDVAAGRAAELHEPGDTTHAGAVDALVALDVRRAIAQPETDPKAIAARAQYPQRRDGFWIGFGLGYGSAHVKCDQCVDSSGVGGVPGFVKCGRATHTHR